MCQVEYYLYVFVVPSSGGNVSSSEFKRRRYTNSSATAGKQGHGKWQWYSRIEAGDIALSADGRILSAAKRVGLFYWLKLHTLFLGFLKYCMHFDCLWFVTLRSNQQCCPPAFRYFHLVLITPKPFLNHQEIPLAGKLSNVDSENLGKFLQTSHSLLGSVLRYGFKTSSGMVPFVGHVLLYKLYPTSAGFKAVMRR